MQPSSDEVFSHRVQRARLTIILLLSYNLLTFVNDPGTDVYPRRGGNTGAVQLPHSSPVNRIIGFHHHPMGEEPFIAKELIRVLYRFNIREKTEKTYLNASKAFLVIKKIWSNSGFEHIAEDSSFPPLLVLELMSRMVYLSFIFNFNWIFKEM